MNEYIIPFGRFKGRQLGDVPLSELRSYYKRLSEKNKLTPWGKRIGEYLSWHEWHPIKKVSRA